jgi:hypothetical protein
MTAGTVTVGGTLDASAPDGGNGGFIETNAAHVEVADDTQVTTAASKGLTGTWLIDPTDFTVAPTGGDITGATLSSDLNSTNFTILSSTGTSPVTGGGGGSNINVNDTVSWSANTTLTLTAANNVNVNGSITASGATAALAINPNTTNGSETASGRGTFNLGAGDSITLSGASASLSIATSGYAFGAGATINLANVSPTSTTALVIAGTPYTVINSLGAAGSTTGTDLQGINGNLAGHYALGSNINAIITSIWNNEAGFTPLGNAPFDSGIPFTGTFDGLGHSIGTLTINLPSTNYVGLFGYVSTGAAVRNLGLTGGSVSGDSYVGGLVGFNAGTLRNSYATGSVSGASGGTSVGGLAGQNIGGTITKSYATASVNGSVDVGGLLGFNAGMGTVSNSYATGTVNGQSALGGLLGFADGESTVSNSYATGAVGTVTSGASVLGGLVGYNFGGALTNSYATGRVSGLGSVGGLVGSNSGIPDGGNPKAGSANVTGSYATGEVSGTYDVGGLVGYNSSGAKTGSANVTDSYATGEVSGTDAIGGLAGENYAGCNITDSYATGAVSGTSHANTGGLVGKGTGEVNNSFWDTTTSGLLSSAGGTGLTTAQMQTASSFIGWSIALTGGSGDVWRIYQTHTFPLLLSFLTPLKLTDAPDTTLTYNGSVQTGPTSAMGGVLGGPASGTNVGFYNGYYSTQQGYDITGGDLTINQLTSVAWVGGASGNWSTASNWAGGAIPDLSNVAAVTIPKATTVTYDAGVIGTTILTTLIDKGSLVMAAGDLSITGNLSAAAYNQTGGTLDIGGLVTDSGKLLLSAGVLSVTGNLSTADYQQTGGTLDVGGTLTDSGKLLLSAGAVSVTGNLSTTGYQQTDGTLDVGGTLAVNSKSGSVILGNIVADSLSITSAKGAIKQTAGTVIGVTGPTSLTADNGVGGTDNITLVQAGDSFGGAVSSNGLNIHLFDSGAGGLILGNTTANGVLTLVSVAGAITQVASTAVKATGGSSLTADNGANGAEDVKYNITLGNSTNSFGAAVNSDGLSIYLLNETGGLILGNTIATGTLTAGSLSGAITQAASTSIDVIGKTTLIADNGVSGAGDVKYAIALAQTGDSFSGTVTADGSAITLNDATALTVVLDSSGATSLTSAGALNISGSVGTTLTTTTSGTNSATTFGATTVGTSLNVTSTGAVTETSSNILTVAGEGTTTVANPNVTVNGVVGAEIPAP